jgi:hypothetical protein
MPPDGMLGVQQMGTYYQTSLDGLLPKDECPKEEDVFFWADRMERTEDTGQALLRGFRPSPSCDVTKYFHEASTDPDRIFHPVGGPGCTLDVADADQAIRARVPTEI